MKTLLVTIVYVVILLSFGCATPDTCPVAQTQVEASKPESPMLSEDRAIEPNVKHGAEEEEDWVTWKEGVRIPRSAAGLAILWAALKVVENQELPDPNAYANLYPEAVSGDPNAQYLLALCYLSKKALPEMAAWFEKAATQGHIKAQYAINICYTYGVGVARDARTAFVWCQKAAEQGHRQAQMEVACMYRDGKGTSRDSREAAAWFAKAAEQEHSQAQYQLALAYAGGYGVPQNDERAVQWFTKAAEAGVTDAQVCLGAMYINGLGVSRDDKQAVKWCTLAANRGQARAQVLLGLSYMDGLGVMEDYVEAYKWFLLAEMQGERAGNSKDVLRRRMAPNQVAEAQRAAKAFLSEQQRRSERIEHDQPAVATGATGFFVTPGGYLLTARHCLEKAGRVRVVHAERIYPAKVVLQDESADVAVLKIEGTDFPCLPLVSSVAMKTGDSIFTMGFPQVQVQGSEAKFTEGSISALSGMGNSPRFFQISVPVQPGNSGGPLVNETGEVVGMIVSRLDDMTALTATGAVPQTVNYAIKSSFILPLVESVPDLAEKLPKVSAAEDRSAAIERARQAVVLIIGYGADSNSGDPSSS